jgi:hypothetical protein
MSIDGDTSSCALVGGEVSGTSTDTSRTERASGIICEERWERAVFVWYGIGRNEVG